MGEVLVDIALVLLFVLVGGVFAAAEIALVSLRESQIRQLRERGGRRGVTVARLAEDPNRFLAAVQIGVTLMGFLSAAFGGATLADELSPVLQGWGLSAGLASIVALVAITAAISYLSILLGELVPKRLALQRAESAALLLAGFIDRVARLSRPIIWLLDAVPTASSGSSVATRMRCAMSSRRRSCATSWRDTRHWSRTSASSSRTSSPPATGNCVRS